MAEKQGENESLFRIELESFLKTRISRHMQRRTTLPQSIQSYTGTLVSLCCWMLDYFSEPHSEIRLLGQRHQGAERYIEQLHKTQN